MTDHEATGHGDLPRRMGIQQIYISHAGKDGGIATQLTLQLRVVCQFIFSTPKAPGMFGVV